jgi:hypothetical protein
MLIAMLVVSIVGAVGFGIVHITIRQLRQQGSLAASARAYQAAEAGLEYALLQYRLDKTTRLGSGVEQDLLGVSWPSSYLQRPLQDDQEFLVRTTNRYQRIGTSACLTGAYTNIADWKNCDGLNGRTLLRLRPGSSVRFAPSTHTGGAYLYFRALIEAGGSVANGYIVVTGYNTDGTVSMDQKVWRLAETTNPVDPRNVGVTASANLATAAWYTVKYINDSSDKPLWAAASVTDRANNAQTGALSFTTDRYLVEVLGRAGGLSGVERRLQAVINARDNSFEGIYDSSETALGTVDYVLSGQSIVTP